MIGHLHLKNWRLAGLAGHLPRSSASSSWSLAEFLIIYFATVILLLEDVGLCWHLYFKKWRLAWLTGLCATSSASPSWSLAKFLIIYFTNVILSLEDVALLKSLTLM